MTRNAFAYIRARLLSGTILQPDEAGLRVGKRNWWLWVFHHDGVGVEIVLHQNDFLGVQEVDIARWPPLFHLA